jgi:hypothetical protein
MKKLITLLLILLTSFVAIGQEKTEFARHFNTMFETKPNKEEVLRERYYSRFIFNFGENTKKVSITVNGESLLVTQIGATIEVTLANGKTSQVIELEAESGEVFALQFFDEHEYGVRLIFKDGGRLHFINRY